MGIENSKNNLIAKNTIALYFRMFLVLAVSLYTSRVILNTLGVNDYGVFNVVGGFVSMLAYLNKVFVDATQRFMVFSLGEKNEQRVKTVFSTAITIHLIIAGLIIIVGESFGLWFVNNKLVIAHERLYAANWVYQCALLSLVFSVISVPYKACIVAHEHMKIYAYFGIIEVVLKLLIVYALYLSSYDKLIVYSILHLLVSIALPFWNYFYCKKHFSESRWNRTLDIPLLKEMFAYSGWVMFGSLGFSFKDQFSNIIMNQFLGTAINAARGIAMQVNAVVVSFAENFTTALLPQITKEYAEGNIMRSKKLVTSGSKLSFYLMSLISIPVILNVRYILKLWLGVVPPYTDWFVIITLIAASYYAASKTLTIALQATGDIKWFQIGVSLIMLTELPMAYLLLRNGISPVWALVPAIFTNIVGILYRMILLQKQVPGYEVWSVIKEVFGRSHLTIGLSFIICYFVSRFIPSGFVWLIISSALYVIIIGLMVYVIGMNKVEKGMVSTLVFNKINIKIIKNR